jgi:hypothetical protein
VREQFYANEFLRGTVLRPLFRMLAQTLGVVFYTLLAAEIAILLTVWLLSANVIVLGIAGGAVALLGLWVLISCWTHFSNIVSARAHVAAERPLLSVEGPAVFWRGRKDRRTGHFPTRLDIGSMAFDLNTWPAATGSCQWTLILSSNPSPILADVSPDAKSLHRSASGTRRPA